MKTLLVSLFATVTACGASHDSDVSRPQNEAVVTVKTTCYLKKSATDFLFLSIDEYGRKTCGIANADESKRLVVKADDDTGNCQFDFAGGYIIAMPDAVSLAQGADFYDNNANRFSVSSRACDNK
jgi:hypothetical protein